MRKASNLVGTHEKDEQISTVVWRRKKFEPDLGDKRRKRREKSLLALKPDAKPKIQLNLIQENKLNWEKEFQ